MDFPQFTKFRDGDVRPKEDQDVTVLRHVVRKTREPRPAHEWNASDTAERVALAPVLLHELCQITLLGVDLIWANRLSKDGILWRQTKRGPQDFIAAPEDDATGDRPPKVFF